MCHLVFRRGRCNIPSFPKSRHWGRCKHVMWREVWSWAVNSEAGQIWAFSSFPLQQQADNEDSYRDRGDASISSRSSWCLRMKWWTDCCDQLFPGFKTPRLWVSARHRHLRPSHVIASASTARIYTAREVERSEPSEVSNWRSKTDSQYTTSCLNPWT